MLSYLKPTRTSKKKCPHQYNKIYIQNDEFYDSNPLECPTKKIINLDLFKKKSPTGLAEPFIRIRFVKKIKKKDRPKNDFYNHWDTKKHIPKTIHYQFCNGFQGQCSFVHFKYIVTKIRGAIPKIHTTNIGILSRQVGSFFDMQLQKTTRVLKCQVTFLHQDSKNQKQLRGQLFCRIVFPLKFSLHYFVLGRQRVSNYGNRRVVT